MNLLFKLNKQTTLAKWKGNTGKDLQPSLSGLQSLGQFIHARITSLKRTTAHVSREVHAGLLALVMSLTTNKRVYVGLVIMGVVAPLAACVYLVFDRTTIDVAWYHLNYFHLFFLLGPHLFILVCLLTAFFLFPKDCKNGYVLIIPAGYTIAKMIWLYMVTDNNELWKVVPSSLILIGVLISAVLFILLDWLAHRKFHGEDSFEAREQGLYNIAYDVDAEKFRSMVVETWKKKKEFNAKK